MKKIFLSAITCCALAILSACSSADGFKAATLGAGAKAGQDYVTGLSPSAEARQYFARIGNKAPIETLTKANAARSKSGVRFVANDGILIPPGVTIQFTNKGYCLDPKLPAPVADEEYQLIPVSALIPTDLQGIYTNLVRKAAAGDTNVKNNMQRLVWALRTAGVDNGYANNLTTTQKSILDSCSSRPGEFESVHNGAKATSMLMDKVWSMADSIGGVKIGGRTYRPSDFRSAASIENAVGSHLNNLLLQGKNLPIQRTGFNFGELQPGIYTDVRGAGVLAFTAKIANATNQNFIFYPGNYVGQVGSGSVLTALASSNNTRRQRVSMGPINEVKVIAVDANATVNSNNENTKEYYKAGSACPSGSIIVTRSINNAIPIGNTNEKTSSKYKYNVVKGDSFDVKVTIDKNLPTDIYKAALTKDDGFLKGAGIYSSVEAAELLAQILTEVHEYSHWYDYVSTNYLAVAGFQNTNEKDRKNAKILTESNAVRSEFNFLSLMVGEGKLDAFIKEWKNCEDDKAKFDLYKNKVFAPFSQPSGKGANNTVNNIIAFLRDVHGDAEISGTQTQYMNAAALDASSKWQKRNGIDITANTTYADDTKWAPYEGTSNIQAAKFILVCKK